MKAKMQCGFELVHKNLLEGSGIGEGLGGSNGKDRSTTL